LPSSVSSIVGSVSKGKHWTLFGQTLPFNRMAFVYAVVIGLSVMLVTYLVVMLKKLA